MSTTHPPQDNEAKLVNLAARDQQQIEPLHRALARERKLAESDHDCLSCRVMGASAFTVLGAYTYWSGHRELRTREAEILKSGAKLTMAARRLGITGLSGMLFALGLYRAFV